MKFNIEPLKGFPLSNDQKETLLGLIKKMCDENNSSKPVQNNEVIQIRVYPNPNSGNEAYVSTKFGATLTQYVDWSGNSTIVLFTHNDELFEHVEKNIQNCGFELLLTMDINSNIWIRTNQYIVQYEISDGALVKDSCCVYFKVGFEGEELNFKIKITKNN